MLRYQKQVVRHWRREGMDTRMRRLKEAVLSWKQRGGQWGGEDVVIQTLMDEAMEGLSSVWVTSPFIIGEVKPRLGKMVLSTNHQSRSKEK